MYIESAAEYLKVMREDKKVKIMEEVFTVDGKVVTIFDVSLHKKGPMEDKIYLSSPFYIANIRRGNSLCLVGDSLRFCRRGIKKFYDCEKGFFGSEKLFK